MLARGETLDISVSCEEPSITSSKRGTAGIMGPRDALVTHFRRGLMVWEVFVE